MMDYARPEVTDAEKKDALRFAVSLIGHKNTQQIRLAVAALIVENHRLTVEVNAHRAARGYRPLETHNERG